MMLGFLSLADKGDLVYTSLMVPNTMNNIHNKQHLSHPPDRMLLAENECNLAFKYNDLQLAEECSTFLMQSCGALQQDESRIWRAFIHSDTLGEPIQHVQRYDKNPVSRRGGNYMNCPPRRRKRTKILLLHLWKNLHMC